MLSGNYRLSNSLRNYHCLLISYSFSSHLINTDHGELKKNNTFSKQYLEKTGQEVERLHCSYKKVCAFPIMRDFMCYNHIAYMNSPNAFMSLMRTLKESEM